MTALKLPTAVAPLRPLRLADDAPREVDALRAQIAELTRELDERRAAGQRHAEELRLAERVQRDFLPRTLPAVGHAKFTTLFKPAAHVSGDLYDVQRLDERHVGVYLCDAVGHGMPAALLTMFLRNALATKEINAGGYRLLCPGETVGRLNRALCGQNLTHASFATATYARLDAEARTLTFASAGHPAPVLIRDGALTELVAEGGLLGLFEDEAYAPATVELRAGDRVLFYSDGVEAAFCATAGDTAAWKRGVAERAGLPTNALLAELAAAVGRADGRVMPKDDVTVIALDVG